MYSKYHVLKSMELRYDPVWRLETLRDPHFNHNTVNTEHSDNDFVFCFCAHSSHSQYLFNTWPDTLRKIAAHYTASFWTEHGSASEINYTFAISKEIMIPLS